MGTGDFFPRGKWAGCEADHSPPSNVDVRNGGAIPTLPTCLHDIVLEYIIKYTDKFTSICKLKCGQIIMTLGIREIQSEVKI
jgi:hypothetical protein